MNVGNHPCKGVAEATSSLRSPASRVSSGGVRWGWESHLQLRQLRGSSSLLPDEAVFGGRARRRRSLLATKQAAAMAGVRAAAWLGVARRRQGFASLFPARMAETGQRVLLGVLRAAAWRAVATAVVPWRGVPPRRSGGGGWRSARSYPRKRVTVVFFP
nr:hypothetical protein Itr_chr01CG23810 [Ipomoea trifida]GLL18459.1 hypothetical protein Itr_chr01CG23820 [Ipomoea trifida]